MTNQNFFKSINSSTQSNNNQLNPFFVPQNLNNNIKNTNRNSRYQQYEQIYTDNKMNHNQSSMNLMTGGMNVLQSNNMNALNNVKTSRNSYANKIDLNTLPIYETKLLKKITVNKKSNNRNKK